MSLRILVPAAFALGTAAVFAACGGGGDDSGGNTGLTNVNISQGTPTEPAARPEATVEVGDTAFNPAELTIKVGTKVTWKWTGTASCAIQLAGTTGPDQSSGTYDRTFEQGGVSFTYQCAGKPDFKGKITVE